MLHINPIWNSTNPIIKKYKKLFESEIPPTFSSVCITNVIGSFNSFINIVSSNKSLLFSQFSYSFTTNNKYFFEETILIK